MIEESTTIVHMNIEHGIGATIPDLVTLIINILHGLRNHEKRHGRRSMDDFSIAYRTLPPRTPTEVHHFRRLDCSAPEDSQRISSLTYFSEGGLGLGFPAAG